MGCPSCGAENRATAPGSARSAERALAGRCPACGHEVNAPDEQFCGACGGRLGGAATGRPVAAGTATPLARRRTRPRHLAEKILASRAALEGERKQVTVLFADVVGSTELIRDLDPEEAQALLDAGRAAR